MSAFTSTILVTGGTLGLGYHAAKVIASSNPSILIVVASGSTPSAPEDDILGFANVKHMSLDLSSLAAVRSFTSAFKSANLPPLSALVANAALSLRGDVEKTVDGYEKAFAISYMGHALLESLLQDCFADKFRLVIVASDVHDPKKRTGMPEPMFLSAEEVARPTDKTSGNLGTQRYSTTKLCNVFYMYAIARRFDKINNMTGKQWTVTAMDPGFMPGTGLIRTYPRFLQLSVKHVMTRMLPLIRLVSKNINLPETSRAR